ncbi:unnamed protein product, partial [Mesorhabditis belari]|uniref:Membrane protein BRI3 n=1 Tax=Mesorhabditis belari TaxID=2138241 RepID=A0AAF3EIC5_9BILA
MGSKAPCPDCNTHSVSHRFTWKGLLYAILCFPCGIYFCFRRRERHCSKCHCEIIKAINTPDNSHGYPFRDYMATRKGLPGRRATIAGYRNKAFTTVSQQTVDSGVSSSHDDASLANSHTDLLK